MSTKYPPPEPPFIKARYHGGSQKPKALVLHGTVSSDNAGTARNIARWWNGPTSPKSSCHYVVDPREVIQCVGDHTVAYHCGYNTGSIGIEFCDEQQGPANRWADADSIAILKRAARLTAELCLAYDIEPVRPSIAALKAKGPHGIYGHNDSRLAFGHTTHTDPRDFPWKKFMSMVRAEVAEIRAQVEGPSKPKNTGGLKDKMKPGEYFVGARGPHVKWLAERLVAHGYGRFYKNGTDRFFSKGEDKRAIAAFQRAQGWSGTGADGLPGPETLRRLAAEPAKPEPEPAPEPEPRKTSTLHLMHASLQFSDKRTEQHSDAHRIFARAEQRKVAWITGTEAGHDAHREILRKAAEAHGYRFWVPERPTDCWIAVRKDLIKGGWKTNYQNVVKSSAHYPKEVDEGRRWGGKGVVSVGFDTEDFGRIEIAAAHYLTGARGPHSPRWDLNEDIGQAIGAWAKEAGKGKALAFYGGDQNMADRKGSGKQSDTFFGEPLTSAWDELGRWENTGHGPIDVIASYDADGRVKAKYIRALDDREFALNTDHFLVEAGYEVEHL